MHKNKVHVNARVYLHFEIIKDYKQIKQNTTKPKLQ